MPVERSVVLRSDDVRRRNIPEGFPLLGLPLRCPLADPAVFDQLGTGQNIGVLNFGIDNSSGIVSHLAAVGAVDGKTGQNAPRKYQALYAYRLEFCFTTPAGELEGLNGRSFEVEKVDFAEEYFGEQVKG